jgi:hypothetical protein
MQRPALEVADIFRDFGSAWLVANRGRVSHAQLKVMNAIGACRTAALGGYVARCENPECGHTVISYCSCRNRHCPKCHVWTAPAVQEESDVSANGRVRSCIRPIVAAFGRWPPQPPQERTSDDTTLSQQLDHPCPHCGSPMVIIETFEPAHRPRHRPSAPVIVISMNTS